MPNNDFPGKSRIMANALAMPLVAVGLALIIGCLERSKKQAEPLVSTAEHRSRFNSERSQFLNISALVFVAHKHAPLGSRD